MEVSNCTCVQGASAGGDAALIFNFQFCFVMLAATSRSVRLDHPTIMDAAVGTIGCRHGRLSAVCFD